MLTWRWFYAFGDKGVVVSNADHKFSAIREIAVFGPVPDAWIDQVADLCTRAPTNPNICVLFFDDSHARNIFRDFFNKWTGPVRPAIIACTTRNASRALREGCDIILAPDTTPEVFLAQLSSTDRRMAYAYQTQEKLSSVRQKLTSVQAAFDAIDTDLAEAKKLQQGLVQHPEHPLEGGQISLLLQERSQIGGDMVGHFPVCDDVAGFFAFDVSGHGITSALLIARLTGMVLGTSPDTNIAITLLDGAHAPRSPALVLQNLNQIMFEELETDHYFTAVLGFFNHSTGVVTLCQAGHPNPFVIETQGDIKTVGKGGLPIGLIPGAEFEDMVVVLEPGQRMLIMSDGITETPNHNRSEQVDETGLISLLTRYYDAPPTDLFENLLKDLKRFQGSADFEDDLSAILLDYNPNFKNCDNAARSPDTAMQVNASV